LRLRGILLAGGAGIEPATSCGWRRSSLQLVNTIVTPKVARRFPGLRKSNQDKKTVARGAGVESAGLAPRCWRPPDPPVTPAQVAGLSRLVISKN